MRYWRAGASKTPDDSRRTRPLGLEVAAQLEQNVGTGEGSPRDDTLLLRGPL
jgi:hypothetical protein